MHTATQEEITLQEIERDFQQYVDPTIQREIKATFDKPLRERVRLVFQKITSHSADVRQRNEEVEAELEDLSEEIKALTNDKDALAKAKKELSKENDTLRQQLDQIAKMAKVA